VSDIERVTDWHITRERYSKYESGSLPMGASTRRHFVDYWTSRGVSGPDAPSGAGADRDTSAPADLAAAIRELVEELRASRLERASLVERVEALETAAMLRGGSVVGTDAALPARQGSVG
jgi:hypothetical protein